MNMDERIARFRELLVQLDDVNAQIAELFGSSAAVKVKGAKQKKWHKANKKGEKVQNEIADHYKKRQHPETARIEQMLIEGASVPEINEKVDVSPPTIYVIKARLKKEGKLPLK